MSKHLIGALVGGLILFIWQFLSWSMLDIHGNEMRYSAQQDEILEVLEKHLVDGQYFLPNLPPTAAADEHQAFMENATGKPWAVVQYHSSMENNMAMSMIRCYVADFLAIFLLIWILLKIPDFSLVQIVVACVIVGLISFLTTSYLNSIWFETYSIGALIDAVVQWAVCGLWLGFWLRR